MASIQDFARRFAYTKSANIGQTVEEMVNQAIIQRRSHERRWYDNNFFDDGYHFRVISKKTGRIVDHVNRSEGYVERAIPRASRQIRGVTNLLFAAEPYPVIYPARVTKTDYPDIVDPNTQQPTESPDYKKAMDKAKDIARRQGNWLSTEWDQEQDLPIKLIDALILAAKNSISWIQIYSDPITQKICTEVFDAFDVIVYGDRRNTKDLPFMTKVKSMDFKEVLSNPMFDEEMVSKLTPDNKYATSEIKDAYMRARYGSKLTTKDQATILVKETFMKEVLTEENMKQVSELGAKNNVMEGKKLGDMVMRHCFSAGGITLKDEYVDYDEYPLIPIRFEPGPLYQVPFIERFIPQNKSVDIIMTRLEKWVNAMVVGVYQKRKGENFQVSNFSGGQIIEYETTPLTQMQIGSVGNTPFNVIAQLNKYIEEQGSSTSALAQLPDGVKSGVAIESVKTSEYSNLKIPLLMLKKSLKEIAERMLERADKDILKPQETSFVEDGEPQYFDVIGKRGYDMSQQVGMKLPEDIIVLDKKIKVRIEIEPGMGLTMEGKRQAMQQIIDYMIKLSELQVVPPEALQQIIKKFLETFGYGSTQEFMEVMDDATKQGVPDATIQKMKVATLEVLKDTGVAAMANKPAEVVKPKSLAESLSIAFKDLPEDTKSAVIQALGFPAPQENSPVATQQLNVQADTANKIKASVQPPVDPNKDKGGVKK